MLSSVVVTLACVITMLQKGAANPCLDPKLTPPGIQDDSVVIPLVLMGVGYSVYACALWGSIPYTVPENLLGSAFGMCTAVQNTGLTLTPLLLAYIQSISKTQTVYNDLSLSFLSAIGVCGFCVNLWLYIDDINNRGGVLNNVAKKKQELEDHMQTPQVERKSIPVGGEQEQMFVGETKFSEEQQDPNKLSTVSGHKDALRRSMARASLAGR